MKNEEIKKEQPEKNENKEITSLLGGLLKLAKEVDFEKLAKQAIEQSKKAEEYIQNNVLTEENKKELLERAKQVKDKLTKEEPKEESKEESKEEPREESPQLIKVIIPNKLSKDEILDKLNELYEAKPVQTSKDKVKDTVDKVKETDAYKQTKDKIKDTVDKVKETDTYKQTKDKVKDTVDKVKETDAYKQTKDKVIGAVDKVKETDTYKQTKDKVRDTINKFTDKAYFSKGTDESENLDDLVDKITSEMEELSRLKTEPVVQLNPNILNEIDNKLDELESKLFEIITSGNYESCPCDCEDCNSCTNECGGCDCESFPCECGDCYCEDCKEPENSNHDGVPLKQLEQELNQLYLNKQLNLVFPVFPDLDAKISDVEEKIKALNSEKEEKEEVKITDEDFEDLSEIITQETISKLLDNLRNNEINKITEEDILILSKYIEKFSDKTLPNFIHIYFDEFSIIKTNQELNLKVFKNRKVFKATINDDGYKYIYIF